MKKVPDRDRTITTNPPSRAGRIQTEDRRPTECAAAIYALAQGHGGGGD